VSLGAQSGFVSLPGTTIRLTDSATSIPLDLRISPLAVSAHEVRQREYRETTGENPSRYKGDELPVENVSWWDAIRYCNVRSIAEKLEPCYNLSTGACDRTKNGYRLLTDAEWTYAAGKAAPDLGPAGTKDAAALVEYLRTHGTKPAGTLPPNEHGLYDMKGNVWEWVQDYQDPGGGISSAVDPSGPASGIARVIRGGSFLTTSSNWSRQLRSSLEADRRSPYTGFRVCRSLPGASHAANPSWFEPYSQIPAAYEGQTGGLSSVVDRRPELLRKWAGILGYMSTAAPTPAVRHIATHHEPGYTGQLMYLQVEQDYWEKIYVMLPVGVNPSRPLPVVIVPFYDVDTPAGRNLGGRQTTPLGTRAYGHLAVQQGMAAVAIRWFGESYGENAAEVVANLKTRHPKVTGMGKWVWDAQRLLAYMQTRPEFDMTRVGMIGHSLGGKMTLYAAAMDDRIRAAVSSEPGIGLSFSNYEDFWYLGEEVKRMPPGTDHHELLALIAPRPFLLIGGDSSDSDKSWHYINAVRPLYANAGVPQHIGYVNHRKGHSPTPESIRLAMDWLVHFLKE
jgi:hypothetical protein